MWNCMRTGPTLTPTLFLIIKANLSTLEFVRCIHQTHFLFYLCLSSQTSYLATFRQIYTVGYATSLIALITAIVVFTAFR